MSNITDYKPGTGSYKVEEAGSLKGIEITQNVDNQLGTLTFTETAFSIKARGLNLELLGKFNSDHLYSTIIKKATKGELPEDTNTLMTLPSSQTNFYKICNGWSWNLPYIIIGQNNVFKIVINGKIFDLSCIITDTSYGDDTGEAQDFWLDSYHIKYGAGSGNNHKSLYVAIPEVEIIITCEVIKLDEDNYKVDYTDTYPFNLYLADGTLLTFKKSGIAGTGHLCKITDAAEKNHLEYFYTTDGTSIVGTIAQQGSNKRMGFTLESGDGEKIEVGNLIIVRDEVRVIWKIDGDTIEVSRGFNFEPTTNDTYNISIGRLERIEHEDGRCVKFYYYTDSTENKNRLTLLLSSNTTMNQIAEGDLFLKRYTFDYNNRISKIEELNTKNFTADPFDITSDTDYIDPIHRRTYEYKLSTNPNPKTDHITIKNHAGALTKYYFQKGSYCSHSYTDGDLLISGELGSGSSKTHINLAKEPDQIIPTTGCVIGCNNEFRAITNVLTPTSIACNAFSNDLDKSNTYIVLKLKTGTTCGQIEQQGTATKIYIGSSNAANTDIGDLIVIKGQIRSVVSVGSNFVKVDSPFTVQPLTRARIKKDWDESVEKSFQSQRYTYEHTEIPDDSGSGDFISAVLNLVIRFMEGFAPGITQNLPDPPEDTPDPDLSPKKGLIEDMMNSVYPPNLDDADEYAIISKPTSYIYYLNKPKIVKIEKKQTVEDTEWVSTIYRYLYTKGGNETIDDFDGGGFIPGDITGPSYSKLQAQDIKLSQLSIITFKETENSSEDYFKKQISFAYSYNKELKGQNTIQSFIKEKDKWKATQKTINVLGKPCANADYYTITSEYHYYGSSNKDSSKLIYRYHIDRDYDSYGRIIRSRKNSSSYSSGQPMTQWFQYVGIGTEHNLDPYNKFSNNPFVNDYQTLFNSKYCFSILGASITQINSAGKEHRTYSKFDSYLNLITQQIVEQQGIEYQKSTFDASTIFRGKALGYSIETDKNKIYWSIDGSSRSNDWNNVRWTVATDADYGTRVLKTKFSYNATTNNLEKITKPLGNEVNMVHGSGTWKDSYVIKDYIELNNNFENQSQYIVNRYDYDIKGRVIQTKTNLSPDKETISDYDNIKYPQKMVEFEYDGLNRVLTQKLGSTSTTPILKNIYDDDNLLLTSTDFLGFRIKKYFDRFLRLIEVKEFKPNKNTNIDYDNPAADEVQLGWTKYEYDVLLNKIIKEIKYTNNDGLDSHRIIKKNDYDKQGRIIKASFKNMDSNYKGDGLFKTIFEKEYNDSTNSIILKQYVDNDPHDDFILFNSPEGFSFIKSETENDWLGRGITKKYAWTRKNGNGKSLISELKYDYAGNITKKIKSNGDIYKYFYSTLNHLEQIKYPDNTSSRNIFDKNGNMVEFIDRKMIETILEYNNSDILVSTLTANTETDLLLTHFGNAKITEIEDSEEKVKTEIEFHFSGRISKKIQTIEETIVQKMENSYDAAGNPTTITITGSGSGDDVWSKQLNISVQHHLSDPDTDNFNNIAMLDDTTPKIIKRINYMGMMDKIDYNTSTPRNITYTFDELLRISSIKSNETTPELNTMFVRDFTGNILSKEDKKYVYDGMGQLINAENENYTYDELSNIITRGNKTYTYQVTGDNKNQMRLDSFFDGSTTYNYSYDKNGNTTQISNRISSIVYDNFNRVRQIVHSSKQDNYLYNFENLRIKKEEDALNSSIIIYTLYNGNNPILIEKYDGSTIVESRFNLIMGGEVLGHIRKIYGTSENYEYFYNDERNCRRVVIDSSGEKLDKFEYSTWGEVTHLYGSNDYLASFTGKEYDDTGFIYFNARYYDPKVGRFITEDPIRKGISYYNYCGNNPVNNIDISGFDWLSNDPYPSGNPTDPNTGEEFNYHPSPRENREPAPIMYSTIAIALLPIGILIGLGLVLTASVLKQLGKLVSEVDAEVSTKKNKWIKFYRFEAWRFHAQMGWLMPNEGRLYLPWMSNAIEAISYGDLGLHPDQAAAEYLDRGFLISWMPETVLNLFLESHNIWISKWTGDDPAKSKTFGDYFTPKIRNFFERLGFSSTGITEVVYMDQRALDYINYNRYYAGIDFPDSNVPRMGRTWDQLYNTNTPYGHGK